MYELTEQDENFILFVRSGNEYYALGGDGEALPIGVSGTLAQGATVTYNCDDIDNICWDFDSKNGYNQYGNMDITPRNRSTGLYLFPGSEGDLFAEDPTWNRAGFHYISAVAEGYNIDNSIGNIIWSWHDRYVTFRNGQFNNEALDADLGTMPADDAITFYCARVTEVKERPTLTAKVVSREEMYNLSCDGNNFILFMRSGNEYYAFDSEANPVQITLEGELKKGAVVTYYGDDTDNILFELDTKQTYAPYANIDLTVVNLKTGMHINPNPNGLFLDTTDYRPGFYYINNVAEGYEIDSDIANIFWSWCGQDACSYLKLVDNKFIVYEDNVYTDSVSVDDSIALYLAIICEPSAIAFNPGNGTGTAGGNDTAGSMFDYGGQTGINRVEIDTSYFSSNGQITVTLPSDEQLGTPMTIVSGDSKQYTIPRELVYDYKLVGWYNIATGSYYDVSNGSKTITIPVSDNFGNSINNVFYGNWVAATYDFGKEHEGTEYNAISTNDFITTKVWDYNELFNIMSLSLEQDGVSKEKWTDTGKYGNTGISSFVFQKGHAGNSLGWPNEIKEWNVSETYDASAGRWGITSTDSLLLKKLFDETGNTLGVKYLGEGDYLFHKVIDEHGNEYYQYDSTQNAASYNQTDQRFYVWDSLQYTYLNEEMEPAFLPFNDEEEQSTTYCINGTYNYWLGMTTEVDFHLADDVGTTSNKTNQIGNSTGTSTTDMIFQFAGDDDVWIFIDGNLVADIGGTHYPMKAEINFSTGEVYVKNYQDEDLSESRAYENVLDNLKAGEHIIKLYYLERGGGGANCTITLNMPSKWAGIAPEADTVSVTKKWENTETTTHPESVDVTLYDNDTEVDTVTLNENNNWYHIWEGLDPEGDYSVKEENLKSYKATYSNLKNYNHLYWAETTSLIDVEEIVILNSNLTSSGSTDNVGYYALDENLNATKIDAKNGVIISNTLTDNNIWTVISSGTEYKLKNKSTGKYLNINQLGELSIVDTANEAVEFDLSDVKGNRFNANINGTSYSVIFENGNFTTRSLGASAGMDYICSRVYSKQTIASTVFDYTITNRYIPTVTLKKIDNADGKPLANVSFTLVNSVDKYYTTEGWVSEYSTITTNASGIIELSNMEDGEYTLTEVSGAPGYYLINTPISFTVSEEKITNVSGKLTYIDTTDLSQLTLIVENVKGYEIPKTGGRGTSIYFFGGIAIMVISLYFLRRKNT